MTIMISGAETILHIVSIAIFQWYIATFKQQYSREEKNHIVRKRTPHPCTKPKAYRKPVVAYFQHNTSRAHKISRIFFETSLRRESG